MRGWWGRARCWRRWDRLGDWRSAKEPFDEQSPQMSAAVDHADQVNSVLQWKVVEAEKKGVDVVLVLADPAGKPLVTADSPSGAFGPEPASLIADQGGEYQIRVPRSPRSAETGRYRIELTDLHAPTEQDRTRLQAETEFFAAVADDRAQDREKRLQGVVGYERAAALWHSLRDAGAEALCLHQIGSIYYNLGEPQKALDYYNQALTLRRAAGDGVGEVSTLNN